MDSLLRLYFEGGFILFFLLLLFFGAIMMMLIQLILVRKIIFSGLFLGLAMAIFALAVVSMARDYKAAIEIHPTIQNPNPIHFFGINEIALIPILFALSMVAILSIFQIGADLLSDRNLIRLSSPMRVIFLIRGLCILGLLVSGAFCIGTMLIANRHFSEFGTIANKSIETLVAYLRGSIVIGVIAMLLALLVVAVSVVSGILQALTPSNIAAPPSKN